MMSNTAATGNATKPITLLPSTKIKIMYLRYGVTRSLSLRSGQSGNILAMPIAMRTVTMCTNAPECHAEPVAGGKRTSRDKRGRVEAS
mmetsp:Transcript_19530/g.26803  ORF Transcript_19530/g.26803 Transcript_19530/m.26803 type:complete len:88 (-) Transcript_19530:326-589(-)